jgi:hypothetical protein
VQPAAAPADETTALGQLQQELTAAPASELLATMLRVGDTELTREGRVCLLVTLSRFAPNEALIDAFELLAWQDGAGPDADRSEA